MSRFIFLRRFVVDMLDLDLYRCDLDPTAFPSPSNESNDSVGPFWIVSGWLCYAGAFLISVFAFSSWIGADMLDLEVYRSDLDGNASTLGSNDPIGMFAVVCGWLRDVHGL